MQQTPPPLHGNVCNLGESQSYIHFHARAGRRPQPPPPLTAHCAAARAGPLACPQAPPAAGAGAFPCIIKTSKKQTLKCMYIHPCARTHTYLFPQVLGCAVVFGLNGQHLTHLSRARWSSPCAAVAARLPRGPMAPAAFSRG